VNAPPGNPARALSAQRLPGPRLKPQRHLFPDRSPQQPHGRRSTRWLEIAPRRATPRGHKTLIIRTARQEDHLVTNGNLLVSTHTAKSGLPGLLRASASPGGLTSPDRLRPATPRRATTARLRSRKPDTPKDRSAATQPRSYKPPGRHVRQPIQETITQSPAVDRGLVIGEQRERLGELVAVERPLRLPHEDRREPAGRVRQRSEQAAGLRPAPRLGRRSPPGTGRYKSLWAPLARNIGAGVKYV
jgi:hypothetical protein